ncbi:MAG TPA: tetratricopeptide repeat protein [Streptosporangiaceae bacterium]
MPPHDRRLDLARAAFGRDPVIDTLRQMAARGQYNEIAVIADDASRMLSGDALCAHLGEIRALVPQAERAWLIIAGLEANALLAAGHASPAIALARQVLQDVLGRFDSDPANAGWQSDLSVSLAILRKAASIAGDPATSRDAYQSALTAAQRLAGADPANAGWQDNVVAIHDKLAALAAETGNLPAAREHYQAALTIAQRQADADPRDTDMQLDLVSRLGELGNAADSAGDLPAAREHYQAALTIAQRQAGADPRNVEWQQALFICHYSVGDNARASGDVASARQAYQRSLDILTRLAPAFTGDEQWHSSLEYVQARLSELPPAH